MSEPYIIEKRADAPIVIAHLAQDYSVAEHMSSSDAQVRAILASADAPLFYIINLLQVKLAFDDVLTAVSRGARGEKPLWHHPMVRQAICVTQSRFIKMAVNGLNSPIFGRLNAKVFETLDEAFAYCQSEIVQSTGG